jgi:hypothetical protein
VVVDLRRRLGLAAVLSVIVVLAAPASAQLPRLGQPPPPPNPPYEPKPRPPSQLFVAPPAEACQTQWGICRVACCIAPGTPCYCQGPENTALPGYAVELFRPSP